MTMNSAWKRRCYIAEKVSTVSLQSHVRASPGVVRPDWQSSDGGPAPLVLYPTQRPYAVGQNINENRAPGR